MPNTLGRGGPALYGTCIERVSSMVRKRSHAVLRGSSEIELAKCGCNSVQIIDHEILPPVPYI